MSDAPQKSYAILTRRGSGPPWICRARSASHAFDRWLAGHPRRKRNVSYGMDEVVYSQHLARYSWTEHVQARDGLSVVVRDAALVCRDIYVTPPSFAADGEVPA